MRKEKREKEEKRNSEKGRENEIGSIGEGGDRNSLVSPVTTDLPGRRGEVHPREYMSVMNMK